MPQITPDITVEEALRELREMFPKAGLRVYAKAYSLEPNSVQRLAEVFIHLTMVDIHKFRAQTMADCLAQVREWKEREASIYHLRMSQ